MATIQTHELLAILKAQIAQEGSQAAWADKHGFSRAFIGDVLHERRNVTRNLAEALGYAPIQRWVPIGEETD